uniref:(northern house mosquito) hypothetical protein n=2 Tax=Culex pipiens TaxID=7175 RepID=A0A8D8NQ08_CULPI
MRILRYQLPHEARIRQPSTQRAPQPKNVSFLLQAMPRNPAKQYRSPSAHRRLSRRRRIPAQPVPSLSGNVPHRPRPRPAQTPRPPGAPPARVSNLPQKVLHETVPQGARGRHPSGQTSHDQAQRSP